MGHNFVDTFDQLTVYRVFSPFYSWFRPVMNSPRHSCIEREVISEILISLNIYRLVFNSPADNDTNEAKIKQVQFP